MADCFLPWVSVAYEPDSLENLLSNLPHAIVGTMVVRTSYRLSNSQQNELTNSITMELTKLDWMECLCKLQEWNLLSITIDWVVAGLRIYVRYIYEDWHANRNRIMNVIVVGLTVPFLPSIPMGTRLWYGKTMIITETKCLNSEDGIMSLKKLDVEKWRLNEKNSNCVYSLTWIECKSEWRKR